MAKRIMDERIRAGWDALIAYANDGRGEPIRRDNAGDLVEQNAVDLITDVLHAVSTVYAGSQASADLVLRLAAAHWREEVDGGDGEAPATITQTDLFETL